MKSGSVGLAGVLLIAGSAMAQDAQVTDLVTVPVENSDGMVLLAKHYDVPGGWQTPPHRHSGDVIVFVVSGEAEIALDGDTSSLGAGDAISATADQVMIMGNASEADRLVFLVHQVSPEDDPYIRVE